MPLFCLVLAAIIPGWSDEPRPEIVLADFEGDNYGAWTVTGTAFGTAPARGTLPNQMAVEGYLGRGLANSYVGGDGSKGRLVSPAFAVERPFLSFLIGGGGFAGQTCVNLKVDGTIVRTATGPNREAGGSERLRWRTWDVSEFLGRSARIEIVDERTGGWGHINVDQIVLADEPRAVPPARREIEITRRYLLLPVRTGAPLRRMRYVLEGTTVREFEIELDEIQPAFHVFSDAGPFRGRRLTIELDDPEPGRDPLAAIVPSDQPADPRTLYHEAHRPQFHFTSRRGWLNDPNGLVWQDGTFHLFYQHNPYGWNWGNMHWGHATSPDLVHWKEQPIALYPPRFGDWCFSGSGAIDERNTSGWQGGPSPPLVVAFTSTGRGECIASSSDHGRSFQEFTGNPVVKHGGRDPKIFWHEASGRWVMAVYDEAEGRQSIAFHTSPDLKRWTYQSRIDGFFECPDLFELPVEGETGRSRWVLHAADGKYLLGAFDGSNFRPDFHEKRTLWYGNFYAAQSFNNVPDGRRIQIGWGQGITFPGMPFNQQMTVPCRLTLRACEDGPRLFAEPVAELDRLHREGTSRADLMLEPDRPEPLATGDLLDIRAEFEVGSASSFGMVLRGTSVRYDAARRALSCRDRTAPLEPIAGRIRLRALLDRGSIEVFGNDGRVALSVGVIPPDDDRACTLFSRGAPTKLRSAQVFTMASAWVDTP
jgi:fructan beta-fructosidase